MTNIQPHGGCQYSSTCNNTEPKCNEDTEVCNDNNDCQDEIQAGNSNQCDDIDFSSSPVTGVVVPAIKHTYECGDMTADNVSTIGVLGTTAKHVIEEHTNIQQRVKEQQDNAPAWAKALMGPVLGGWFNN